MRPIIISKKKGQDSIYNPWRLAKLELINEIGAYCVYCEKKLSRSALDIDHVLGKKVKDASGRLKYEGSEYTFNWNNFMLACKNCNSIKSNKDIAETNPYLPHTNNLLHFMLIKEGGLIEIKKDLARGDLDRVQAFFDLVGLDRNPGHKNYSQFDDRWESRLKAFDIAKRQLNKYEISTNKPAELETIVTLAEAYGFFSVWYYQFINYPDVLNAIINGFSSDEIKIIPFPGTHTHSFEPHRFQTLRRN